jgi:isopentenyl-diphosphate delta-isomerase
MDQGAQARKTDHLRLCAEEDVEFHRTGSLLSDVHLVHQALPELALDDIDLGTELCGKRLSAPLLIAGMTGGTPRAGALNRELAQAAETLGIGFGLGSQRPMLRQPELCWTYQVREVAPTTLLLANLGLWQACKLDSQQVAEVCRSVGADALCLHLNAAMELVQPEGDRDFRGGVEALARLTRELELPVIAKETGCGISRQAGSMLAASGVRMVDVGGAGGTSWTAVEVLRASGSAAALGEELREWGIPTAASLRLLDGLGLTLIATGGIRSGLDVARCLALGAHAAGIAAPVLRAHHSGGYAGVVRYLKQIIATLRAVLLLCGARTPEELRRQPVVLGEGLRSWIEQGRGRR